MAYSGYTPPDHLVSTSLKMKEIWYKNACNYYIKLAIGYRDTDELDRLMQAFSGGIRKSDYHYILNPYNFAEDRLKNLPGRLRNYDIIAPLWRRYMGEYSKSSNRFSVIAANQDVENQFENGLIDLVNGSIRQIAANSLNKNGIESGLDSKDTPNLADQVKKRKMNWKETRAEIAQERLDFLNYSTGDAMLRLRAYSDWINYAEFYTYREVRNNDVFKETVPIDEYYAIDNGSDYVEDHDAGVRIRKMTIPQIIEAFHDRLDNEQLKYLRDLSHQYTSTGATTVKGNMIFRVGQETENIERDLSYSGTLIDPGKIYTFCDDQGYLEVATLVYKTQVQTKILTYINPLGEKFETEVFMDYKIDKFIGDIKTQIIYRLRVYEQHRLGDEHAGIYLKPEEIPVQRTDLNNANQCKLPFNGRRRIFPGFPNHGIIKVLLPYQIFINILYLSRERAIAKNQGKIMIIPQSLVNSDLNLSEDEKIYYMMADGKLYADDTAANFAIAVQALKSVETGDTEYILGLGSLIEETKQAAQEDVDMNRQRLGQTLASDGKYTTQQALFRSSLGSAIINETFNKTFEKDYEADMDYSKIAWIDGKKGNYINSDKQVAFFQVNGTEHSGTSYGIFAVNSVVEEEDMKELKALAFSAGQNGDLVVAAEAIRTDSSVKLSGLIREYDELLNTRKENSAKAEQDAVKQVAQIESQTEQAKLDSNERIAKYDGKIKFMLKQIDILIAELKIASDDEQANIKARLEDKKIDIQSFIQSNEESIEKDQAMLGLL